jgi:hypothetical protein
MVFIFLYCDPVFSSSENCLGFRDWIRNHSSLPNEFEEGMVDLFVWILLIPYPLSLEQKVQQVLLNSMNLQVTTQ